MTVIVSWLWSFWAACGVSSLVLVVWLCCFRKFASVVGIQCVRVGRRIS